MSLYASNKYRYAAEDKNPVSSPQNTSLSVIPYTYLYQQSPRFDFVHILATEDETPPGSKPSEIYICQIGCIIAIHKGESCVKMYILGLWTEELHYRNGPEWASLMPRSFRYLKYQPNVEGKVHRQLLDIESIASPACIIATDCKKDSLHLNTYGRMKQKTLLSVDFTFFTRYVQTPLYLYVINT